MTKLGRIIMLLAICGALYAFDKMPKPAPVAVPEVRYEVAHSEWRVNELLAKGWKLEGAVSRDFLGGMSQAMVKP
jgi:hypothetical protein